MSFRNRIIVTFAGIALFSTFLTMLGGLWLNNRNYTRSISRHFSLASSIFKDTLHRSIDNQLAGLKSLEENRELTRDLLLALSTSSEKQINYFKFLVAFGEVSRQHSVFQSSLFLKNSNIEKFKLFGAYYKDQTLSFPLSDDIGETSILELEVSRYGLIRPYSTVLDSSVSLLKPSIETTEYRESLGFYKDNCYIEIHFPLINPLSDFSGSVPKQRNAINNVFGLIYTSKPLSGNWLQKLEDHTNLNLDIYRTNGQHHSGDPKQYLDPSLFDRSGIQTIEHSSGDFLGVFSPIFLKGNLQGYLLVSTPKSALKDQFSQIILTFLLIGILIIVVTFPFMIFFSGYFTKPIEALQEGAEQLAEGLPAEYIDIQRKDEIGKLGQSFIKMRDAINAKIEDLRVVNAEMQEAKGKLEFFNVDLERKIEERTNDLQVALSELKQQSLQLEKAKNEAETANTAKSNFLANMSHEIRTPLNAILGITDLLSESDLSTRQQDLVNTLETSGELLHALINDILDFSKIEAGQIALESIVFNIVEHVENIVKVLANSAFEKGINIACHIDPRLKAVRRGDPTRLRQILMNLLGNAIKFTHQGEVLVEVTSSQELQDETIKVSIRDSGIGIAPEKQKIIFDSFSQADMTTSRKYGGTGLGLAITRQLIDSMNGELRLESEVGQGSTFTFFASFPVVDEPTHTPTTLPDNLKGLKVLVVDDKNTNCIIYLEFLGFWGARAFSANGGSQAIQKIIAATEEKDPYQLILLDFNMPEMDGFEVFQQIRKLQLSSSPRVVMLTSGDRTGSAAKSSELGLDAYLIKPVRAKELLKRILKLFDSESDQEIVTEAKTMKTSSELKILLAEDIKANQMVILMFFKNSPIKIDVVEDGEQAVQAFKTQSYDCVLMDIQMPIMDGYEATKAIRTWEKEQNRDETPIIALTAHAFEQQKQECLDAGCSDFLSKPIKRTVLFDTLTRYFPETMGKKNGSSLHPTESKINVTLPGLFEDLVSPFFEEIEENLIKVDEAAKAGDFEEVVRVGHGFKGASQNYQLKELSGLFLRMERAGQVGSLSDLSDLLVEIREYIKKIHITFE